MEKLNIEELTELSQSKNFQHKQQAVEQMHAKGFSIQQIIKITGFREYHVKYFIQKCCN